MSAGRRCRGAYAEGGGGEAARVHLPQLCEAEGRAVRRPSGILRKFRVGRAVTIVGKYENRVPAMNSWDCD